MLSCLHQLLIEDMVWYNEEFGVADEEEEVVVVYTIIRAKLQSNKDMNKIEVSFPSSNPSCRLYGDLYLPSSTVNEESLLLPVIVITAGSGVSPYTILAVCVESCIFCNILNTHDTYIFCLLQYK